MKLAIIEGDGVGKEVIPAAVEVLDALGLEIEKVPLELGYGKWERTGLEIEKVPLELGYGKWERTGTAITDEDVAILKECDCVLFGAVTTPPDPNYKSVLLTIRKKLDVYANIRPIKPLAGIKGATGRNDFDFIIVRENTEGMYSGIEELHDDVSYTTRVITRKGSKRIAEYACKLAKSRQNNLTIVHKSNVLKSDNLFLDTCRSVADDAGVTHSDALVDSTAYSLITSPQKYDVLVTTNLFGDILSDMSAALVGSLGLAPSANIGEKYAFFEPVHGSAPDIAGKGIANPIAAILCVKMMMEWRGDTNSASLVEDAVNHVLQNGIMTPELGGTSSTKDVGHAVAEYIKMRAKGSSSQ